MSYSPDRDGLAACPDNLARTLPPMGWTRNEERRHSANVSYHTTRTETRIRDCLMGRTLSAQVLFRTDLKALPRNELADLIFDDVHGDRLADVLVSEAARDALIQDLASRTGKALANLDDGYESFL